YEAMVTVGELADGPQVLYRGIWPSYLAAPLAAAATAGRLLELDEDRLVDALAIAAARGSRRAGRPGDPTSRWFLFGCAAADGVQAALAAARGLRGDPALLDSVLGDRSTLNCETCAIQRVDVKPFCTARQAQAAVQGALALGLC